MQSTARAVQGTRKLLQEARGKPDLIVELQAFIPVLIVRRSYGRDHDALAVVLKLFERRHCSSPRRWESKIHDRFGSESHPLSVIAQFATYQTEL